MSSGLTPRSAAHHFGPTASARHFIYRCYDAEGTLLYIGCTVNVSNRISAHQHGTGSSKASKWLAACMVRFEIEGPFDGREAGRDAEGRAIKAERPLFNYQGRADVGFAAWMTRTPVARYLIDHGHLQLAADTACNCWPAEPEFGIPVGLCVAHELLSGRSA